MEVDLKNNQRYSADITLPGMKILAPNAIVVKELEKAGFDRVYVTGSGQKRFATGRWAKPSQRTTIPNEVSNIETIQ